MGGGLLQLVAYGAQDVYLTGNPQITFFKVVYRRHTNFSMEAIEQTFNGTADFGKRVTCQISRNGDLIHRMYLVATFNSSVAGASDLLAFNMIKSVELEIGGQRIDKQYGDWMFIWNELSLPYGKRTGFNTMVLKDSDGTKAASQTVYVPLEFWFCRNPGLALPLIALQYHEVKVNLEFEALSVGSMATAGALSSASLWVDYIFLDTDERRRFAQLSHEYLIEQLQFTGEEAVSAGTTNRVKLNFNHPVKELVWVTQTNAQAFGVYTGVTDAKLQLNGHDRFATRLGPYFTKVQPYQHHTNIPETDGINVYSFALRPEEHQPSGTLNMSRIDNATLAVTAAGSVTKLRVYAHSYNVLRVMSGMGGLAYSN